MASTPLSRLAQVLPKHKGPRFALALAAVLVLRSRLLELPQEVLAGVFERTARKHKLSPEELSETLQKLYVKEEDGRKMLLVPHREGVSKVPIQEVSAQKLAADAKHYPPIPSSHRPNLDKTFFRQLRAILRLSFPSWHSKDALILYMHSFFLVLRTVLSIGVARLDGRLVRNIVSADGKGFLKGLGLWFLLAIPSTYTNTMIHHLQAKISLNSRTRLTRYIHDLYLSSAPDLRYYRVGHEGGLEGVDQYITSDVSAFCDAFSQVYGNVLKPSLDMFFFTSQLSRTLGLRGTVMLFANYYVTAKILRFATPAFGRLAAIERGLEGDYRASISRVGRESEEVAFYNGGPRERNLAWATFEDVIDHVKKIYRIRILYEFTEDFVIKYLWSAAGYCLIAIPVLFTRKRSLGIQTGEASDRVVDDQMANRTETYISSRRLLLSLADAGGRLMYAYKDLLELAGLTTRLYTLLSTLHSLKPLPSPSGKDEIVSLDHVDVGIPTTSGVPLVLVRDLSLSLKSGEHLMITGSNGVGKTAVARVIAGLWAAQGRGEVRRPAGHKGVFVVPQRSYMVAGTLLDQIIYPHSYPEFVESGRTEAELMEILAAVNLAYLPAREGGWSTRKEWRDVLSGGEKQRMGMARVFYHRPRFAVLDECTSAVSSDVEGRMYEHAKSIGITLITISLRPSLMRYHTQLLTINGDGIGSWHLSRVGAAEERMGIDREIVALEQKLADVDGWEVRLKELTKSLSAQVQ